MLKVKSIKKDTPPVRHVENIRGVDIPLYIRPWDPEISTEISKKYTRGFEWVPDAAGRKVKQDVVDRDGLFDAQLDYVLDGFDPVIGDEDGTPWPVDLEHKKKLVMLVDEPGRVPIYERIINVATALAFEIAEEGATDLKN
jgi:hypothetical protein